MTLSESFHRRVLVVDADLRRPSIHRVLGIPNGAGIVPRHSRDHRSAIAFTTRSAKLSVLTAGDARSAPLAGLTSERMGALLDAFEQRFRMGPDRYAASRLFAGRRTAGPSDPVGGLRHRRGFYADAVERAVAALGPECILGTVLNRVDARRIHSARSYDYYDEPESADS